MEKVAAIDIGTNSVLYSLCLTGGERIVEELYFERHSPRLGRKLAGQNRPLITDDSYDTLRKILAKHIRHAVKNGVDHILLAATNPLRLARNGREVKKRLEHDLGHKVVILSSDREAYLSFLAAAGRLKGDRTAVVIDMGGGSTELVAYRGEKRLAFVSLPEGAVSLTERFQSQGKVEPAEYAKFEDYLSQYSRQAAIIRPYLKFPLKLVGGTSTALGFLKDPDILQKPRGVILTMADFESLIDRLGPMSLTGRRRLLTLDKKRAEIIFAGAFWYRYLFKILNVKKAVATPSGLRHGMVLDFIRQRVFTA